MRRREISITEFPMPDPIPMEGKLLNSILADANFMPDLMRIVKAEFFSSVENRKVWETLVEMYRTGESIELSTIFPKVDRKNLIDNVISAETTFGQGILQLGCALMETYIKREAYNKAVKVLQGVETGAPLEVVTGFFSDFNKEIEDKLSNDGMRSSVEIANILADDIQSGKIQRVPTPFASLNYYLYGGFGSGNLIILAARPSVGKTTVALQMAQCAALSGRKACFFSLEMTAQELVQRLIVGTGLVSTLEIVTQNVNWENYERAVSMAVHPNLKINDKAKTLEEICTRITLEVQSGNCQIAFVDYLTLVRYADRQKTQAQIIGEITARLKSVAKECNIPVVLLSQLNRESAKEARSPQLYDLKDSGSIEQDADVVVMLERPKDDMGVEEEDKIDMWVRKNRGGKRAKDTPIHLIGNSNYSDFQEESVRIQYDPHAEDDPTPVDEPQPVSTDLFDNQEDF